MTAQIAERMIHEGQTVSLMSNPLDVYFDLIGEQSRFEVTCTALWRGYVGTWEIVGDRLYLVGLDARYKSGERVRVDTLFPGYGERVFAHWYSGTLRLPQGKRIRYVHGGYDSEFERDLLLSVEHGVVVRREVRHNGEAPNAAAEGDSIAGVPTSPPGTR